MNGNLAEHYLVCVVYWTFVCIISLFLSLPNWINGSFIAPVPGLLKWSGATNQSWDSETFATDFHFIFALYAKKKGIFISDAWPFFRLYLFCVQVTFSLCKLNHYCQLRKQWSLTLLEIQLNGNNKLTVAVYLSGCCNRTGPQCKWISSLRSISSCWGPCVYVCENMCTVHFCSRGQITICHGWLYSALLSSGLIHTHELAHACKNESSAFFQ